jgi:hypothetical protein
VSELVQHRFGPTRTRGVVAEDAHIAVTVDVDAECMLHLARARDEVAAGDDTAHVESHRFEAPDGELLQIGIPQVRIEVDADRARRVLEEGIVVVPGPQCIDGDREALRELLIELRFHRTEGCVGDVVDLGEGREQAIFVEVGGREREGEVITEAERPGCLIAEPDELAHVGGNLLAHALRGRPRRGSSRRVVTRPQYLENLVVVDRLAVDRSAVPGEARLDVALELDDLTPQVGADLVRCEALLEHVELARDQPVEPAIRPGGAYRREGGRIGERVGERDVGGGAAALRVVARVDICVPPRGVGGSSQWLQGRAAIRDQVGRRHLNQMRW